MLYKKIREDMQTAMKERNPLLDTYRAMITGCTNFLVEKGRKPSDVLSDEEVEQVLQKLVKQHRESAEQYRNAGSEERALAEDNERALIASYLPQALSEDEVRAVIKKKQEELKITTASSKGKLIGAVMRELGSKTDGDTVSRIVGEVLS